MLFFEVFTFFGTPEFHVKPKLFVVPSVLNKFRIPKKVYQDTDVELFWGLLVKVLKHVQQNILTQHPNLGLRRILGKPLDFLMKNPYPKADVDTHLLRASIGMTCNLRRKFAKYFGHF
jgi:hypothetical protein